MSENKSVKSEKDAEFLLPVNLQKKAKRTPNKTSKSGKASTEESKNSSKKKMTGPYVHMEKNKGHRMVFSIVNHVASRKLVEKDPRKNLSIKSAHVRRPSFMTITQKKKFTSTLPAHASPPVKDSTWVCVFCKQGSHFKGLGDLFGPYFIHQESQKPLNPSSYLTIDKEIKMEISETSLIMSEKSHDKRKRSDCNDTSCSTTPEKRPKSQASPSKDDSFDIPHPYSNMTEVWFHEDCIVWCNGVFIIAKEIRNMDEAINDSSETVSTIILVKI